MDIYRCIFGRMIIVAVVVIASVMASVTNIVIIITITRKRTINQKGHRRICSPGCLEILLAACGPPASFGLYAQRMAKAFLLQRNFFSTSASGRNGTSSFVRYAPLCFTLPLYLTPSQSIPLGGVMTFF